MAELTTMWSLLNGGPAGIILFLIWLVLPPLYVVTLGRRYVRQCAESAEAAVWAREELRSALEELPSRGRHRLEET
jgi:hypothetical protein